MEGGTQFNVMPAEVQVKVQAIPTPATRKSIPFRDALRLQESFTARVERKALLWLATRLPSWVNSDHLTLLGFAAAGYAGTDFLEGFISQYLPQGARGSIVQTLTADPLRGRGDRAQRSQNPA